MSNILTLYNMEFKRIYKLYFALIGVLFLGNIGVSIFALYFNIKNFATQYKLPLNLEAIRNSEYVKSISLFSRNSIVKFTLMIFVFSVLLCLIYALVIWYRDYFSKSKTICTLLTLPQKRFNIYISKLIMIAIMIYGVIVSQYLFWSLDLNIAKFVLNINNSNYSNLFEVFKLHNLWTPITSMYFLDFLMINTIGVILAIVVTFTGVLIERSYKKIGVVLGVAYIVISIAVYIIIMFRTEYTDTRANFVFLYYIILFTVSLVTSYRLINKRIYL